MKKSWMLPALLVLLMLPCLALANGYGTLHVPPQEVLEHIASRWPAYELEDYCEIEDTPKGDYGFALLKSSDERLLVGYHEEAGEMKYWLKNAGAVPQYKNEAAFAIYTKGSVYHDIIEELDVISDGTRFAVRVIDDNRETIEQSVTYQWKDDGFKLVEYSYDIQWHSLIRDGYLDFWNLSFGTDGRVYGGVQTDIRYVSYNALPKTIDEARETITTAPQIVVGNFHPKEIQFTGGQKYPVYTGPGEDYVRSGNGKGQVSTNDWIQVFGQYGDFIMIQYDISADQFRIGWIDAASLPRSANVSQLWFEFIPQVITQNCTLTDDPLNSRKKLLSLKKGTEVVALADFGEHYYIEVTVDGETWWGFIDADCVTKG